MKFRNLLTKSSILSIVLLLSLASCTKKEKAPEPTPTPSGAASEPAVDNGAPKKKLRSFSYRLIGDPETLDWNRAHTAVETYLLTNLMDGLVTHDAKMNVIPALAEKWEKSLDGKTYTFKLRKGVQWSDGIPLRASDFVNSWKRLISPLTAASYAYLMFDVLNAEDFYKGKITDFSKVGIKAPDDNTVVVELSKPVAHFIHIPTFWVTFPIRQDIVDKYGTAWAKPGRMVTVGPYTLDSYDIDSRIVFKANPKYYGEHGNIEEVIGLIVKDDSTALNLYETGKLDFLTDISAIDLKRLEGRSDLQTFPYLKTGYMGFVLDKFPMSNLRFRRAIAMSIDTARIGDFLYGGQKPAHGFIPFGMTGYNAALGLKYDPVAAKKELKLSGIDPATTKIEVVIPNWDKPVQLAQFIQAELKKNLGVELSIQPFDHKTFRAQLELFSYPMFILSWSADFPDPDNFMSVFLSFAGNNRLKWKNETYDAKVLLARFNQNAKAREKLYDEAQKILVETDVAIMPLYNEPILALVNPRVKNVELNALNYLRMKKINLTTD